MPTVVLGLPTRTESALPIRNKRLGLPTAVEEVLPLVLVAPYNNALAAADDISDENGYLPTYGLNYANTEAGEYTNGLLATIWWLWTCPSSPPYSITWAFDWAGQSGSGGGSVRVYATNVLTAPPAQGLIVAQHNPTGASGTATTTLLSPVAGQTYLIQQGIKEKAGTQGHFSQLISWLAPPAAFTPVIP
jgi:hypothetical protein